MTDGQMCDFMKPRPIIARLRAEGVAKMSEYGFYLLLKTGKIPSRKVGRDFLVSYQAVLDYLRCADGGDIVPLPPVAVGECRRVGL